MRRVFVSRLRREFRKLLKERGFVRSKNKPRFRGQIPSQHKSGFNFGENPSNPPKNPPRQLSVYASEKRNEEPFVADAPKELLLITPKEVKNFVVKNFVTEEKDSLISEEEKKQTN